MFNDNPAFGRMDDQQHVHDDADELARRRLQQVIEDDERLTAERKARAAAQRSDPSAASLDRRQPESQPVRPVKAAPAAQANPGEKPTALPAAPDDTDPSPIQPAPGVGPVAFIAIALVLAASCYLAWLGYQQWFATGTRSFKFTDMVSAIRPAQAARSAMGSIDPAIPELPAARTQPDASVEPTPTPAMPEPVPSAIETVGAKGAASDLAESPPQPAAPSTAELAAAVRADKAEAANAELLIRLAHVESTLAELRDRLPAKPDPVTTASPVSVPAVATAARPIRKVAARAAKSAPLTIRGGQLLAVDMWNGMPSVVVGTGLPGDTRVRVLKQGDRHNGVALLKVDPVARTATFGVNGKSFTLSVHQGG